MKYEKVFFGKSFFAFSFESHGRCMTPQRFPIKENAKSRALISFMKTSRTAFSLSVFPATLGSTWAMHSQHGRAKDRVMRLRELKHNADSEREHPLHTVTDQSGGYSASERVIEARFFLSLCLM